MNKRIVDFCRRNLAWVLLLIICIIFSFTNGNFLTVTNLLNILNQNADIIISTYGIALIMMSGGLDMAVGFQMSICGVAAALMLNAGSEDMFSTMDLLLLDLSGGRAEFVKLAACPALIARDGAVTRVEGGRLPLGILERVQPAASRVQLVPGDLVLMASDGVMDAADPDALEALLLDAADAAPSPGDMNALAEQVLRLAESGGAPDRRRDDMTAVCLRLERRSAAQRASARANQNQRFHKGRASDIMSA